MSLKYLSHTTTITLTVALIMLLKITTSRSCLSIQQPPVRTISVPSLYPKLSHQTIQLVQLVPAYFKNIFTME